MYILLMLLSTTLLFQKMMASGLVSINKHKICLIHLRGDPWKLDITYEILKLIIIPVPNMSL